MASFLLSLFALAAASTGAASANPVKNQGSRRTGPPDRGDTSLFGRTASATRAADATGDARARAPHPR